jgi:CPA1 family monovalent cation:H+ antiporter
MHEVVEGMPWAAAFALGAIVSPPDAVAATSVLRQLGVRRRVQVVLEGESLVNDASGLLLYRLAVMAAVVGGFTVWRGIGQGVWMVVGGTAVGLAVGCVVMSVHRRLEEPTAETVIALLTPYAASLPAEALGASSVLAVAVTGLYVSHNSARLFTVRSRLRTKAVWDTIEFLFNGLIFVLMGLQMRRVVAEVGHLASGRFAGQAALLIGVVILARFVWAVPTAMASWTLPAWRTGPPASWGGVFVVAFTGMRGVISLAAALAIPMTLASGEPFPQRGLIIVLTFVVILVTLVGQSLALPWVVRWLGMGGGDRRRCEEWEARLEAVRAALRRLDEVEGEQGGRVAAAGPLRELYREQERALLAAVGDGGGACRAPMGGMIELRRELIDAERERLLEMFEEEQIDEEMLRQLQIDLDLEELRLPGREG